jgi:hypothetical protein
MLRCSYERIVWHLCHSELSSADTIHTILLRPYEVMLPLLLLTNVICTAIVTFTQHSISSRCTR